MRLCSSLHRLALTWHLQIFVCFSFGQCEISVCACVHLAHPFADFVDLPPDHVLLLPASSGPLSFSRSGAKLSEHRSDVSFLTGKCVLCALLIFTLERTLFCLLLVRPN